MWRFSWSIPVSKSDRRPSPKPWSQMGSKGGSLSEPCLHSATVSSRPRQWTNIGDCIFERLVRQSDQTGRCESRGAPGNAPMGTENALTGALASGSLMQVNIIIVRFPP